MTQLFFPLLGAVLTLAMLLLAFSGPSGAKAQKRRLEGLRERHGGPKALTVEDKLRRITTAQDTKMDSLAGRLLPNPALLKKRLAMTGKDWSVGQYVLVNLGIAFAICILLLSKGAPVLLGVFGGLMIGLGLPHMLVGMKIKKRIQKFTVSFPDAIDLLVRGLRAGLPISETLGVVSAEIPGPVGEEFRIVTDKMKIGRTMDVALQETADRLGIPEFQFFCITLAIQKETGGNLAETLSNLADVLRKRAQMKLKIKAMSSESKASAYIVGSLPFIVFGLIWFINNKYMGNFFSDERLMIAGIGGLIWMAIGAFIMAKMVNFEI
ncbi:type II secretion system F family protein [Sphingomonas sp.]|jgi:tight adherence protein B|uniref:type II secretion system F family protein n=1 Tax=Sphingomonas sp. TaxID=28214 RepID=UPI002DBC5E2B|nr:type II secretion system F family protein [Sphingomonas sp.]HEU4969908.1 type II secretion system F family protein [Sphingomonas sp.]